MKNEWLRECIRIVRKGQTLEDQDICLRTIEAALAELAALEAELEACKLTAKYLDEGAAKLVSDNAAMREAFKMSVLMVKKAVDYNTEIGQEVYKPEHVLPYVLNTLEATMKET